MSCWTMGLNQSTHGTWNTNALVNLHLATGAICRPGSGPFSLTGQPNAMGGREMGYMGPGPARAAVGAGRRPTGRSSRTLWELPAGHAAHGGRHGHRRDVPSGWPTARSRPAGSSAPTRSPRSPTAAPSSRAWRPPSSSSPRTSSPRPRPTRTPTSCCPAAMWAEAERRHGQLRAQPHPACSRPSTRRARRCRTGRSIARVAREMGYADAFALRRAPRRSSRRSSAFCEPADRLRPARRHATSGCARRPVQWPAAPGDGPTATRSGTSTTASARRAGSTVLPDCVATRAGGRSSPARTCRPPRLPDDDYPFVLNTGRLQHQWHTLTKTGKVAKLNKLNPGPFVEIHPADAARLGIADGDSVEVASRRGRAVLPAVVTDRVRPGCCFAPFHWNDLFGEYLSVNAVTNDAVDPLSFQPEFKVCAVSLTRVALRAARPRGLRPAAGPARSRRRRSPAAPCRFGLDRRRRPSSTEPERQYLSGFLAGTATGRLPAGVPVLPADAPVRPGHARVGRTAARRACTRGPRAGSRPGVAASEPASVGRCCGRRRPATPRSSPPTVADRLAAAGHGRRLVGMDDVDAERLAGAAPTCWSSPARSATATRPTTAAASGTRCRRRRARAWTASATPCWPSATPATTTSAGTAAASTPGSPSSARRGSPTARRLRTGLRRAGRDAWLDQVLTRSERRQPTPPASDPASAPHRPRPRRATPRHRRRPAAGNRLLSLPGSAKEVRQFTFDTERQLRRYEAGDALGVWPRQLPRPGRRSGWP